ncbi:MAG: nucleotidyltransferase family protein, partial [Bradyrhizobium sp.]
RHLVRRRRQQDQLRGIVAALNGDHIEPVLLKGARYLLAPEESWQAARDMRDIDLLVRADDAHRASAALEALGYSAGPPINPVHHHLPELWHPDFPSAVEIHTEALAFASRSILATDEVWRLGRRSSAPLGSYILLPDEWHLLHCLLHHQISDRGHVRRILAVKPLWEFAMQGSELSDQAWHSIAGRMAERGHPDVLGSWIVQAARLYGLGIPRGLEIPPATRAHANSTFAHAGAPEWLRRSRFLVDQFRFAFSPTTLGLRYGIDKEAVSVRTIGHHVRVVLRRHRGRLLRRLLGTGSRPS